ncbi:MULTISPECIES: single-stranded DNA-binding protein [unclassified Rothia (in: high G+C Gram-positive bacteria)]|uniref:single-stranded DNA-binding protein n=1 Tax=unclassified Rothia (in: high G+C Gram-positive bacteria) TaxID=2689056 RepID=UPI0019573126|nr:MULTISPECIES: single-stranded DNA-binding protein [unclassified Rothia (in: high G+C Gram-positive bacteria)]MBM7050878.1 single-stranded DNA-binding protein [Rothia sp. ZJ1223]QRZ62382.1 single-stranded DNA-binding protein [Rothia sp. ZJ932]
MSETIIVRAFAATAPVLKHTPNGAPVTNFRIASTPRWYDQAAGMWREAPTNWYTVNAFRALAQNVARSIRVGQPVIVSGRLKIKKWDREDGTTVTNVEIDAQAVGHDLNFGTAGYERSVERRYEGQDQIPSQGQPPAQNDSASASLESSQPQGHQQNTYDASSRASDDGFAHSGVTTSYPRSDENNGVQAPDSLAGFGELVEDTHQAREAITTMTA